MQGDQASIVGGAIDFVKELEHILQSLEAKKFLQLQAASEKGPAEATPFAQFFTFPQFKHYTCSTTNGAIADIEVTLVETHANIRVLSRRRLRQLSKLIGGFQELYLTILHLNVTSLETMVLYSISSKVCMRTVISCNFLQLKMTIENARIYFIHLVRLNFFYELLCKRF